MRSEIFGKLDAWCKDAVHEELMPEDAALLLWTTEDSAERRAPAEELVGWVLKSFGDKDVASGLPEESTNYAVQAFSLVKHVVESRSTILSDLDCAWVLGARGMLGRIVAGLSQDPFAVKERKDACADFAEARRLLKAQNVFPRLQRHFTWLYGETLAAETTDAASREAALIQCINACVGSTYSTTRGLYFNCLSRILWLIHDLPVAQQKAKIERIKPSLYEAWTSLSVGTMASDHDPNGGTEVADITGELLGEIHFEPYDRIAVCAMLYFLDADHARSLIYGWEVISLIQKLEPRQLDDWSYENTRSQALGKLLKKISRDRRLQERPQMPFDRYAELHDDEGNPQCSTIAITDLKLRQEQAPRITAKWACGLRMAETHGQNFSAAEELTKIQAVLTEILSSDKDAEDVGSMEGHARRLLARHFRGTQQPERALEEIRLGKIAAGRSGDVNLAIRLRNAEHKIMERLGMPLRRDGARAQVSWEAGLWDQIGWHNLKIYNEALRHTMLCRKTLTASQLHDAIQVLKIDKENTLEVDNLEIQVLSADHAQEFFYWCSSIVKLLPVLNKLRRGKAYLKKIKPEKFKTFLSARGRFSVIRASEFSTKAALFAAAWCRCHEWKWFKKDVADWLFHMAEAEYSVIKSLANEAFAPESRKRLRKLLSCIFEMQYVPPGKQSLISALMDACKAVDADGLEDQLVDGIQNAVTEETPLLEMEAVVASLNPAGLPASVPQGEAVLSFFISPDGASTVAVLAAGEVDLFYLERGPGEGQSIWRLLKSLGFKRSVDSQPVASGEDRSLASILNKQGTSSVSLWEKLTKLGAKLFPEQLMDYLKPFAILRLVPDGDLFRLPIHFLPTSNSKRLIDDFTISYLPRATWREEESRNPKRSVKIAACVDPSLWEMGDNNPPEADHFWEQQVRPDAILSSFADADVALFFVHGHPCRVNARKNRLALRDGGRLTAHDVLVCPHSFKDTDILLFACHSAWPDVRLSRHVLGVLPAFLRRGSRSITGSLWQCSSIDAARVSRRLINAAIDGESLAKSFSDVIRESIDGMNEIKAFIDFGCFVHYGK